MIGQRLMVAPRQLEHLPGRTHFFRQSNLLGHLDNLILVISTNQAGEIVSVMLRNIFKTLYSIMCCPNNDNEDGL